MLRHPCVGGGGATMVGSLTVGVSASTADRRGMSCGCLGMPFSRRSAPRTLPPVRVVVTLGVTSPPTRGACGLLLHPIIVQGRSVPDAQLAGDLVSKHVYEKPSLGIAGR